MQEKSATGAAGKGYSSYMRSRICAVAVSLCALAAGGRAQEGPTYVPCIDTWAINSSSVLVAKIVEVCSSSRCGAGAGGGNTVALKVERTLKGDEGSQLKLPGNQLKLQLDARLDALKDWKKRKASLLIFDGLDVDPVSSVKAPAQVMDLSDAGLSIITKEMQVLHDPDEILAAAESAIKGHPGVGRVNTFPKMLLNETMGLNNGTPPLALVPVDAHLESWARAVLLGPAHPSLDAALRPEAVRALEYFQSEGNVSLLRTLLNDPANVTQAAEFNLGVEVRTYPVRQEAYTVLKAWKVDAVEPLTREEKSMPEAVRTASLSDRTGMIGQTEIKKLARFENLERLDLRNDHLTAQAYQALPRLGNLRALGLAGSNINDGKLADLAALEHLEALDLTATAITDAGLQKLVTLPELKSLNLTRTKVTAGGIKQMQKQRPDVMIEYR